MEFASLGPLGFSTRVLRGRRLLLFLLLLFAIERFWNMALRAKVDSSTALGPRVNVAGLWRGLLWSVDSFRHDPWNEDDSAPVLSRDDVPRT